MHTAHLDEIIWQKDPALKQTVEQLAHGQVQEALENLTPTETACMKSRTVKTV
jgi:hypothetical protein